MTRELHTVIETATAIGAARAMEDLGITSGEVSTRRARSLYGRLFTDAVKDGRLRPVRVCDNKKQLYRVADILAIRLEDAAEAVIKSIES